MAGLWLEEFKPGMVISHAITRTVTEADNIAFSTQTMNPQPLHIDRNFAAQTEWGRPLVNSLLTLGIMIGISVHETTLGTTVGNLGMTDVIFPAPVFHGDSLRVETEVISARASKSRAGQGIVELIHRAYKQDATLVASCRRSALMRARLAQEAN
ncbi:MaoC family dehydratase [Sulfitobacter sp. 1A12056]|uniref:MaoC family dehydratase n=1 Tax=Sulfitobacter sp. 1A12056 TaxID=3368592 RepID=UPI0037467CCA